MRLTKNKHLESKLHFGVMKTIIAISLIQSVPTNNFVIIRVKNFIIYETGRTKFGQNIFKRIESCALSN